MPIWLSWKLDGLTLVLTYDGGRLVKILTRGNGTVGSNITFLQDAISGFPKEIPYKGHMVVRGEATISYTDFKLLMIQSRTMMRNMPIQGTLPPVH